MANRLNRSSKRLGGNSLYDGKRMSQPEFHIAYDAMPDEYRAELIAGTVREPSPLGWPHATTDPQLSYLLQTYAMHTPGVQLGSGATVILGQKDELQPDAVLRIAPECRGQSKNIRLPSRKTSSGVSYVHGAPELVAEIAQSSRDRDLGVKKQRYAVGGVLEYIVVCLEPQKVYWFDLKHDVPLAADADGIFRSAVFPGLWIYGPALLELNAQRALAILQQGLASAEHNEFVREVAARG